MLINAKNDFVSDLMMECLAEVYLTTRQKAHEESKEKTLRKQDPTRYGTERPSSASIFQAKRRRIETTQ